MNDALERELVALFHADADEAPPPGALIAGAVGRARRRRAARLLTGAVVGTAAGVAVAFSISAVPLQPQRGGGDPAPSESSELTPSTEATQRPPDGSGPLPIPGVASCIAYSATNVANAPELALDGTVVALGPLVPQPTNRNGSSRVTTLKVNEWFHGGSGATVTVEIPIGGSIDPGPPAFTEGTRLLISGSRAWRRSEHATAWGCGFTRYHDTETAGAWRKAHG